MKIPDSCKPWREKMENGSERERRVLNNIIKDNCVKAEKESNFFDGIGNRLTTEGIPATSENAWRMAIEVVTADPDTFVCQGNEVSKTLFKKLLRLEDVNSLRWHLPDKHLMKFGIRDSNFDPKSLPTYQLKIILADFTEEVKLGNKLDIVRVSDENTAEKIDLRELPDRLGLANLENQKRCLKVVYKRDDIKEKKVHLPRSLDGINQSRFVVVEDCNAEAGRTLPLYSLPEKGLPEGVHRGCGVKPDIFDVESLE